MRTNEPLLTVPDNNHPNDGRTMSALTAKRRATDTKSGCQLAARGRAADQAVRTWRHAVPETSGSAESHRCCQVCPGLAPSHSNSSSTPTVRWRWVLAWPETKGGLVKSLTTSS